MAAAGRATTTAARGARARGVRRVPRRDAAAAPSRAPPAAAARRRWALSRLRRAAAAGDFGSLAGDEGAAPDSVSQYGTEPFGRLSVRDPFRRLGVGKDATFDEIKEARSYLMDMHGGDERSRESIEGAYDKIVTMKLNQRKAGKINILGRDGAEEDEEAADEDGVPGFLPNFLREFIMRFQMPEISDLMQRLGAYLFLSAWSVMQATQQGGPAFQVAVAFFLGWYAARAPGRASAARRRGPASSSAAARAHGRPRPRTRRAAGGRTRTS